MLSYWACKVQFTAASFAQLKLQTGLNALLWFFVQWLERSSDFERWGATRVGGLHVAQCQRALCNLCANLHPFPCGTISRSGYYSLLFPGSAKCAGSCRWSAAVHVRMWVRLSVHLSIQCVRACVHTSAHASINPSLRPSLRLSIHPCIHASIHASIHPSIHPCLKAD